MIEQVSNSVKFVAFFTANKTGTTGLTVTVDVYNPSGTQIVTGGSATAIGGGLYGYTLSSNNSAEGEYAAIFKTTDSTVDAQHIPSLWVLGRAGVENLDGTVSSRLATSGYTAPSTAPTAAQNATAVWGAATKEITGGTVTTLTNAPTVPTAAAIASQVRTELATELARVDVATSTRLATSGYTAPSAAPTAAATASAVRAELATELARVDAAVSTRLAASAYTAPSNSDIAAIKAKTDNLPASPAATGDIPSANITAIKAKTDLLNTDRLAQVSTVSTTGAQLAAALS